MSEQPATEARGGENPDWKRVKPGEELPELEASPARLEDAQLSPDYVHGGCT